MSAVGSSRSVSTWHDKMPPHASLQPQFDALCLALSPNARDASARWFSELVARYTEPQRAYHTLHHIGSLLSILKENGNPMGSIGGLDDKTNGQIAIEAAIWFHDAVYDPRAPHGDNERASESLWREFCEDLSIDRIMQNKVSQMILATISHVPPDGADNELLLFLDLDLSILAAPADVSEASWKEKGFISYSEYVARVRKEYSHYSDADFRTGRLAVMKRFLDRPQLYFNGHCQTLWEQRARENIRNEINLLESQ